MEMAVRCGDVGGGTALFFFFCFFSILYVLFSSSLGLGDGCEGEGVR